MLDRAGSTRRLSEVGWLAATPQRFRDAVLERCTLREFDKGAWIYRVGDGGDGLWGVAEGAIYVELTQGVHAPRAGIFAAPGFWTGEGSVLLREARSVGLRATRPTQMAHLSQNAFLAIATDMPDAWRWVGLLTFFHMVSVIGLREDLCLRDPEARVLATLYRMTHAHWGGPPPAGEIDETPVTIDASQSDLAELCNVSRAFIAHLIAALKREGLVEPGYGHVRIPNPGRLRQRIRFDH